MHLFHYFEINTSLSSFMRRFLVKHSVDDDEMFCVKSVYGIELSELRVECDVLSLPQWKEDCVRFAVMFEDLNVTYRHFRAISKLLLLKNVRRVSPFPVDDFVIYECLNDVDSESEDEESEEDEEDICIR